MQTILGKTKRRAREEEKEDKEPEKRKEKREGKNEVRNWYKYVRRRMRRGGTGTNRNSYILKTWVILRYITFYDISFVFI